MKTKQEMISRSIYMPKNLWQEIDKTAEQDDLSANQVIRRLVSSWLLGFMTEKQDKDDSARPVLHRRGAPLKHDKPKRRARARQAEVARHIA